MTTSFFNRVKFISTSNSTTSFIVATSALTGFQLPSTALAGSNIANGTIISYSAYSLDLTQWECGSGTYLTNSTSNTLARTTIFDSSAGYGSVVNFALNPYVQFEILEQDIPSMNAISISIGNSTVNSFSNSSIDIISNVTAQTVITPTSILIGNSTVNTVVNSSVIKVFSNTGLQGGSSSLAANGYTWLPNGLLLQWGAITANITTTFATFATPFPTAVYSIIVTANVATSNGAFVLASNTTGANIVVKVATASVNYIAIGH